MAFKINPITGKLDYYEAAGVPGTHAGTHVTGGGDTIADAVAAGNSGLMSGTDKTKLDGIAAGAEVNVNADWNSGSGDSQILNKPTIPTLDYKLKVSTDDTTPNWLSSKIDAGDALGLSVSDEGANEVLKLDVQTQMSITYDVNGLKLSGDSAAPGNTMLYGTNGSGTKGWYAQPSGSYTDEEAQDAVGAMADSNSLTYTDVTPLLAVKRQMSITADASGLKLDGDATSPGNSYFYGTNGSGTKGWYAQATAYTDEMAQDAVGAMVDSNSLTYTDATPKLEVKKQMSITSDASGIKLDGDAASPGNSYLYGTNSGGTKGWYAQPSGLGYCLSLRAASQATTTDSQTMYWGGMLVAPSTTANRWRVYIPKAGTITACYIYSYSGTAGTGENWSMYIRKNNTSDTLVQTLGAATNDRVWSNTGLSIAVVAGDYIEIKEVQPAWATNPATVTRTGVVYIS